MNKRFYINNQSYIAKISKGEKYYIAECEKLKTVTQGKTIEESLKNIKEASELMISCTDTQNLEE